MLNRKRRCKAENRSGDPCGFQPMLESDLCWVHDPENEEAAQEARRLGGVRRKRESTLAGAFEFDGILAPGGLARYVEIMASDTLGLEFGYTRVRAMVAVAGIAEKVIHAKELEERIADLESVLGDKLKDKRR